jgi:hypothetical protein
VLGREGIGTSRVFLRVERRGAKAGVQTSCPVRQCAVLAASDADRGEVLFPYLRPYAPGALATQGRAPRDAHRVRPSRCLGLGLAFASILLFLAFSLHPQMGSSEICTT